MEELYRTNITIESQDQFEDKVKGWIRGDSYVGTNKSNWRCIFYLYIYEAFIGGKNKDVVKQFCRNEINKVRKKGYNIERAHIKIEKVKEARGKKIYLKSLELRVKN